MIITTTDRELGLVLYVDECKAIAGELRDADPAGRIPAPPASRLQDEADKRSLKVIAEAIDAHLKRIEMSGSAKEVLYCAYAGLTGPRVAYKLKAYHGGSTLTKRRAARWLDALDKAGGAFVSPRECE